MIDTALLKALGGGLGGGAAAVLVGLAVLFPTKGEYEQHTRDFDAYTTADQAGELRTLIQNTVERAGATDDGEYKQSLCRQLEQAISELCAINEKEAMCVDRDILRRQAGCS